MGFEDRDYNRFPGPQGGGFQMPQSMVGKIIFVNAVVYLIDSFWNSGGAHPLNAMMSLPPDIVSRPWALITYGFAHSPIDERPGIWHILFNMYGLWLFGREVEQRYGSKEFLTLYLSLIAISGAVWALLNIGSMSPLVGASGAVSGVMVLYCVHFPHRKFLMFPIPFQVPAWALCIFIIGMDIMGALGQRGEGTRVAFAAHLAGAAAAFLYFKSGVRLRQYLPGGMPSAFRGKPKLKVHQPSRRDAKLESQADAILQKVHQNGADSITAKERRILDEYSRSVREKRS